MKDIQKAHSVRSRDIMQRMHTKTKVYPLTFSIVTAIALFIFVVGHDAVPSQSATPYLGFYHPYYVVGEADGTGIISVSLYSQVSYTISVDYGTFDQTAVSGIDYIQTSGTLTFTPGITLNTFTIDIIDDYEDVYSNLQVGLAISNPVGALLSSTQTATLTIVDDELSYVFLPLKLHRHPPPPVTTDLLLNSGFENGFTHDTFNGSWLHNILTPKDWITWWEDEPSSVQYPMHAPEVRPIPNEAIYVYPVPRIRSGHYAIQMFRTWGRYRAGFYQQVQNLTPGTQAYFSYHAHAWSCGDDPPPPLSCGDPYAFYFQAGIDPTGGTNPWSDSIVWSDEFYIYDAYDTVGPVQAPVGEQGQVTVYILAYARYAVKFNDAYFDDAVLALQQP